MSDRLSMLLNQDVPDKKAYSKMDEGVLRELIAKRDSTKTWIEESTTKAVIKSLESEMDELRSTIEWKPGSAIPADVMKIGGQTLFQSGVIWGIETVFKNITVIIRDGNEAQSELDRRIKDAEKKQKDKDRLKRRGGTK